MKNNLNKISAKLRGQLVELSNKTKSAHLASCLSSMDILVVLYEELIKNSSNRFIMSKGHAANALYVTLAEFGYFDAELLNSIGKPGSKLEEHPAINCMPGVENASGSLGHGLPIATGLALSNKIKNDNSKTFILMGDGECNEGSIWEAAMFATAQKMKDLCVIIDFNKWQATGRSCEIMALEPLREKWDSFGWNAIEIDGHNLEDISKAFKLVGKSDKPTAIIAHTVKGKGISFMEDDNNWHYRIPTEEEVVLAKKELGLI